FAGDGRARFAIESAAAQLKVVRLCLTTTDGRPLVSAARDFGEFHMEVILKEDVANLGHRGDVVKVADGYGRNFLLPRKLALQATLANKAVIEQMKAAAARRSAEEKVQA